MSDPHFREGHDIDRRVAVLEEIARNTATALGDIRAELRLMRQDTAAGFADLRRELGDLRRGQREDFRFLMRVMIGGLGVVLGGFAAVLALIAHGFHWL